MNARKYPSQSEIKTEWKYRNGHLWWREKKQGRQFYSPAGTKNGNKIYKIVRYKGTGWAVHRLIYIYHYGEIKRTMCVDHIDQNKYNNDIKNLRLVTHAENLWNSCKKKGYWKNGNKFTSEIYYNKNRKIIGHFKTKKEAQKAHDEAKAKYHIIKDRKPCV
ncbi:HNH endonuclease [Candidatus Peregrinibacteria bacterium]|jgi:hypothetical protein|nr:HNH endonuclease [Candidatus Peregrinibacteria bacterium]